MCATKQQPQITEYKYYRRTTLHTSQKLPTRITSFFLVAFLFDEFFEEKRQKKNFFFLWFSPHKMLLIVHNFYAQSMMDSLWPTE